jgi:glutaminyl-peptide cyclotransferase
MSEFAGFNHRFVLPPPRPAAGVPLQTVEITAVHPHDPGAFTQGLLWCEGRLYESTGQPGHSELREVRLEDGAVLRRAAFPAEAWGEGIADWLDEIVALTLDSGIALRWSRADFAPRGTQPIAGKGWGLARVDGDFAISDGTPVLRFVDPCSLALRRTLCVLEAGRPLGLLNDLAFVQGELLANVFRTDTIARIDPATGAVRARLDLSAVAARSGRGDPRDVLNGIACDAEGGRLFVTGKNWPRLFEIRLPPLPG